VISKSVNLAGPVFRIPKHFREKLVWSFENLQQFIATVPNFAYMGEHKQQLKNLIVTRFYDCDSIVAMMLKVEVFFDFHLTVNF